MRGQRVGLSTSTLRPIQEGGSNFSLDTGLIRLGTCSIDDLNKHCLTQFRAHWMCLENNNQQLWQCRKMEKGLNKCVYDNLVRDPAAKTRISSNRTHHRSWRRSFPELRRTRFPYICAKGRHLLTISAGHQLYITSILFPMCS